MIRSLPFTAHDLQRERERGGEGGSEGKRAIERKIEGERARDTATGERWERES